jgi:hypothetical protein
MQNYFVKNWKAIFTVRIKIKRKQRKQGITLLSKNVQTLHYKLRMTQAITVSKVQHLKVSMQLQFFSGQ